MVDHVLKENGRLELDRRAKGKGKGVVVHQIWRSISKAMREALDVEKVWCCRE
jgi:hypothetical protein